MKRVAVGLLGFILFVSLAILGVVALGRLHLGALPPAHVYAVAEVQDGLRRQPQLWVGRTVLIRGDVKMVPMTTCSTICQSPTFIYLGPSHSPQWNQRQQAEMLQRLTLTILTAHLPAGQRSSTTNLLSLLSKMTPTSLLLQAPNGSLPVAHPHGSLPDYAYTLPVVGSLLERVFPLDNRLIVRVHLTSPQTCTAQANSPCADGVLLSSL